MKKAALILGSIFILVALVVFWKLRHSGPLAAAELVPDNTIVLIEAPDLPSSLAHWNESNLSKLAREPEIEAFLQRPLDRFYEKSGVFSSTMTPKIFMDILRKIRPGRCFVALEAQEKKYCWIAGCQFFGNKTSMEEGLLHVTQSLDSSLGIGHEQRLQPEQHHAELIKTRIYSSLVLYSAIRGNWCFVSNNLEALQTTLDLYAHSSLTKPTIVGTPSLSSLLIYQQNRHHLFLQGDLFCYLKEDPGFQKYPYLVSLLDEEELIKFAQASGASFRFTQQGMEERLFFSGDFNIEEHLSHQGLHLTELTTLGFIERLTHWKQIVENLKTNPAIPTPLATLLANSNLDLFSLAPLLKSEMILNIDWPSGRPLPSILLMAPENDSEKMANWLDQAALNIGTSLQASDQNDLLFFSIPKLAPNVELSMASANGLFFIASDSASMKERSSQNSSAKTLETAADFSNSKSLYHEANEAFFYFNSQEIVKHIYPLARPSLLLGGAMFSQAKAMIDFSRLPSTATVTKYLTPIAIAQSHYQDGFLIQSQGSLSATPLYLIGKTLYQFLMAKREKFF